MDLTLNERASAHFHIQNMGVDALGQLLRHDRRGDQRYAFHGAGGIAQRVNQTIGRRQLRRLTGERQPDLGNLRLDLIHRQIRAETGNGFQFIQRATGKAQCPAADHRDLRAGRGRDRGRNQAGFVAHATGRVLVHLQARNIGQVQGLAAAEHQLRHRPHFLVRHPRKERGHQECRHLVVGNFPASIPIHKKRKLFRGKFLAIPLPGDQVDGTHISSFSVARQFIERKPSCEVCRQGTLPAGCLRWYH